MTSDTLRILRITLYAYPVLWLAGIAPFVWPLLAIPLALRVFHDQRLAVPRWFGIWALFIGWTFLSAAQLDSLQRIVAFAYREGMYLTASLLFLIAYHELRDRRNLTRLIHGFGWFFVYIVAGGWVALVAPTTSWISPVRALVPQVLLDNQFVSDLTTVRFASVISILSDPVARPAALFTYANQWGSTLTLLVPVAITIAMSKQSGITRSVVRVAMIASIVPLVASLNRGAWVSAVVGIAIVILRRTGSSPFWRRFALLGAAAALALVLPFTYLGGVVVERVETPHSNEGRQALYELAWDGARSSPIIGHGGPRQDESLRSGKPSVGTHGHFWLVLFSQGFPGALLFIAWWLIVLWRIRQARSELAVASQAMTAVALVQIWVYELFPAQLPLLMLATAIGLRGAQSAEEIEPPQQQVLISTSWTKHVGPRRRVFLRTTSRDRAR